jgi:glutathione transport system ATP-binding protein
LFICLANAWALRESSPGPRSFLEENIVPISPHIARSRLDTLPPQCVLAVDDLSIAFREGDKAFNAVRNLSLTVDRGETLAIVGESGSGKSVTSLALMRLIEHGGGRIASGSIAFRRRDGHVLDLARASSSTMRSIRGADIAMIFQEPMTSLNPVFNGASCAGCSSMPRRISRNS